MTSQACRQGDGEVPPAPEQAAYEAYRASFRRHRADIPDWAYLTETPRAAWKAAAQAAIASQQAEPAPEPPGLRAAIERAHACWSAQGADDAGDDAARGASEAFDQCAIELAHILDRHPEPRLAPELAALRDALERIITTFSVRAIHIIAADMLAALDGAPAQQEPEPQPAPAVVNGG